VLKAEVRGISLDGGRRRLAFGGSEVYLTRQEWDLLSILFSHPDRFISARNIMHLGWRAGDHAAEQIRTYVHRLRQKLEPLNLPCRLMSQHGQGYCLAFATLAAGPAALSSKPTEPEGGGRRLASGRQPEDAGHCPAGAL
jgi:DNA-binding response OmpR family regulator